MQSDGPVVLDFDAEQVRHYGVELVFVYKILVGDPGRMLLEFYELMFEQGLVHRTIDRFVNILFLGVKILFEAAKGWQVRFPTGKIEPFCLQNQGASSFRLRSIYRFLLF